MQLPWVQMIPDCPKVMVLSNRELKLPMGNFTLACTLGRDFPEGSCPGSKG